MYAVLCDIAGNSRDSEPILLVFAVISGRYSVTAHLPALVVRGCVECGEKQQAGRTKPCPTTVVGHLPPKCCLALGVDLTEGSRKACSSVSKRVAKPLEASIALYVGAIIGQRLGALSVLVSILPPAASLNNHVEVCYYPY